MSLIQVARYSDVKYDFKDGFARVPVLENAFDQACFAHCALQPGHSITPDVYSVTEHNQLFFFTKGKGYITTPRQAWNINEPGVFVPEFDTERFTITCSADSKEPLNCSPSRGQRKNIKFSRPAAKCCWPLFMQQGTTCVFLSASARPSYAGLFWCCNNGCSTQSFARVPVCW